ncbi:MAG: helix-turn-helix domain-containing protein [Chloroflexota bacterium]|nr:helix-turn-helix domain-containing protein [Chloroflexota bacterium]
MSEQPVFLNALEAAEYLGVNKQRVYELARAGRIGRRIGGYWLFTETELEAYKAQRELRPRGGRPRKRSVNAGSVVSNNGNATEEPKE